MWYSFLPVLLGLFITVDDTNRIREFWVPNWGFFMDHRLFTAELYVESTNCYIYNAEHLPVTSIVKEPAYPIFIAANGRVYRSEDGGTTWMNVSPADVSPRDGVTQLTTHRTTTRCYVIAVAPGVNVFWSRNFGERWSQRILDFDPATVTSCEAAPDIVSDRFYIYMGTTHGVYRKAHSPACDWELMSTEGLTDTNVQEIATCDTSIIYVRTLSGVFKYTLATDTWIQVLSDTTLTCMCLVNPDTIYVGTSHGVLKSDNAGGDWVTLGPDYHITAINVAGDTILVGTSTSGVFISFNGGTSWQPLNDGLQSLRIRSVFMAGDTLFAGTAQGLAINPDATSWHEVYEGIDSYYVSHELLNTILEAFESTTPGYPQAGVYEKLVTLFGTPPDVDNDPKVYIIVGDFGMGGIFGEIPWRDCFDPINELPQSIVDSIYGEGCYHTNEAEILYLNTHCLTCNDTDVVTSLGRSLSRMIHWKYDADEFGSRKAMHVGRTKSFIVEGISELLAYLLEHGDSIVPTEVDLDLFPTRLGSPQRYPEYAFSFMMYLYEHYGGLNTISAIMYDTLNGMESIASILNTMGYDICEVMMDWITAIILDDEGTEYGFDRLNTEYYTYRIVLPMTFSITGWSSKCFCVEPDSELTDTIVFDGQDNKQFGVRVVKLTEYTYHVADIVLDSENIAKLYIGDVLDHTYDKAILIVSLFESATSASFVLDKYPRTYYPAPQLYCESYQDGEVPLWWTPPVCKGKIVKEYQIDRTTTSGGPYEQIASTHDTCYVDTTVINDTDYYYIVKAIYTDGGEGVSNEVHAIPTAYPPPYDLLAYGTANSIVLVWKMAPDYIKQLERYLKSSNKCDGLVGFNIYRRYELDSSYVQIGTTANLYFEDTTITHDTAYYVVTAVYYDTSYHESPYSNEALGVLRPGDGRPRRQYFMEKVGELWTVVSNFGNYGDPSSQLPSYDWPGYSGVYYLWEGRLWIGAMCHGSPIVSHADYGAYEWYPSAGVSGDAAAESDLVGFKVTYDDWNHWFNEKPLGLQVEQWTLASRDERFDDIIFYIYRITYHKEHAYYGDDSLHDVYVGWCFDADVGGRVEPGCNIDDWVCYDGWENGEWTGLSHEPKDLLTIVGDTVLDVQDGVLDYNTIWGDEPFEYCITRPDTVVIAGDTFAVQLIPRNISYMYDGDNPHTIENDSSCYGKAAGYIWLRVIYAPPSPTDSVWIDEHGDTCRLIRPYSHTWWNWENDPGIDADKYAYMTATHPLCEGHRFMPHPADMGAGPFDYRWLLTYGPYELADGDTLEFVVATGVGQLLNGGVDEGWGRGYLPGARQMADRALLLYYLNSEHSDPIHPSAPDEDKHFGLEVWWPVEEYRLEAPKYISVRSNPFANNLHIELYLEKASPVDIRIYNVMGRLVDKLTSATLPQGKHEFLLGIDWPPGVYFMVYRIGDKIEHMKLIKLR